MRMICLVLLVSTGCTRSAVSSSDSDGGSDGSSDGGACPSSVAPAPGLAVTDRGPVQAVSSNGTWAYFAIPYAAPPVGDLRWRPPADPACWSAPIANTTFGSMCLQLDAADPTKVIGSEDCLTLNVWAPAW